MKSATIMDTDNSPQFTIKGRIMAEMLLSDVYIVKQIRINNR